MDRPERRHRSTTSRTGSARWYGPNNAVLVLAGDIDVATAKAKVAKYFGDIPAGPTHGAAARPTSPRARETTRETMTDRCRRRASIASGTCRSTAPPTSTSCSCSRRCSAAAQSSRLDQRLVHDDKLVDSVSRLRLRPSSSAASSSSPPTSSRASTRRKVEAVDRRGAAAPARARARPRPSSSAPSTVFRAGFVRGIERIGGFGGKADALAECAVYTGNPGCFRDSLARIDTATPADVKASATSGWQGATRWSCSPASARDCRGSVGARRRRCRCRRPIRSSRPRQRRRSQQGRAGDQRLPRPEVPGAAARDADATACSVILAERHDMPVVQMSCEFPARLSPPTSGRKLGTSSFTMGMLDEGAGELDALAFGDRAEALGASIGAGAGARRRATSYLSALKEKLDAVARRCSPTCCARPRFDSKRDRARARATGSPASSRRRRSPQRRRAARAAAAAVRRRPSLRDARSPARGTEASIASLTRDDLRRLPPRLAAPGQRHADRGRRHHARGNRAAAREALRRLEGAGAAPPSRPIADRSRCRQGAARVPDRPARRDAGQHLRRPAGRRRPSDAGTIEFDIANARARRRVHLAPEHEPARGQALVLRRATAASATRSASARGWRSRRCRSTRPSSR